MESEKEFNAKLKNEINARFDVLFKKIGNNRQQLANKVVTARHELIKELNKAKVDAKREAEILREVTSIEKMAAKQLPHLERTVVVSAPQQKPIEKPSPPKTPATPVPTPAKSKPAAKKPPAPAKKAAPKKKK